MKITHIECSNIKSFKSLSADLTDFNVIIGMNGSGKSNFILIFKVIKDILCSSLAQAVANQGGAEFLKDYFLQKDDDVVKLKFTLRLISELSSKKKINGKEITLIVKEINSDIEFMVNNIDQQFTIVKDELSVRFEYFVDKIKQGSSSLKAKRNEDKYNLDLINYDTVDYELHEVFAEANEFEQATYTNSEIVLHKLFSELIGIDLKKSEIPQISVYEFEQDLLTTIKANTYIQDEKESREMFLDLLQSVLADESKKRTFFNLLNFVLPDIDDVIMDVNTKNNEQRFLVKERFNKRYIPAYLLSDGTVFLIVIILALYFDNKYLTIFDEPERRIHPHIISKVIDMMKDVSREKQIILSTHNSEIVKFSGLESIILIARDDEGYSKLSRPNNSDDINVFLMNEIGLDELFVQNMLN